MIDSHVADADWNFFQRGQWCCHSDLLSIRTCFFFFSDLSRFLKPRPVLRALPFLSLNPLKQVRSHKKNDETCRVVELIRISLITFVLSFVRLPLSQSQRHVVVFVCGRKTRDYRGKRKLEEKKKLISFFTRSRITCMDIEYRKSKQCADGILRLIRHTDWLTLP